MHYPEVSDASNYGYMQLTVLTIVVDVVGDVERAAWVQVEIVHAHWSDAR